MEVKVDLEVEAMLRSSRKYLALQLLLVELELFNMIIYVRICWRDQVPQACLDRRVQRSSE